MNKQKTEILIRFYSQNEIELLNHFLFQKKQKNISNNDLYKKALIIGINEILLENLENPLEQKLDKILNRKTKQIINELTESLTLIHITNQTNQNLIVQNLNMTRNLKPDFFTFNKYHDPDLWNEMPEHILVKEKQLVDEINNWTLKSKGLIYDKNK